MLRIILTLLLTAVALSQLVGCEEVSDSTDIPYTPHIVVYATLYGGDTLHPVRIARTLPVSVRYEDSSTWLANATVTLTVDGNQTQLRYIDSGLYSAPKFPIEIGKTYRLDVQWNGLHTSGTTTVPEPAPIDTGRGVVTLDQYGYMSASVWLYTHVDHPVAILGSYESKRPLTPYDSIWMSQDPNYRPDTTWRENTPSYGDIALAAPDTRDSVNFRVYTDFSNEEKYRVVLYTYDEGFYEFARTYNRYYDDGSPFGSGGINPKWNVDGDGIGIFTGVGVSKREVNLQ